MNSGSFAKFLDEAEDVIPAPAVQARGVLAQFVKNFVHLERGQDRLDQNRRADRSVRQSELILRVDENIVPQAALPDGSPSSADKSTDPSRARSVPGVVKEIQAEVEERTGHRLAIHQHMALLKMPAARPDKQRRRPFSFSLYCFLSGSSNVIVAPDGVPQVQLTFDQVVPRRRGGILEIRHEHLRA